MATLRACAGFWSQIAAVAVHGVTRTNFGVAVDKIPRLNVVPAQRVLLLMRGFVLYELNETKATSQASPP
jgi:hypothetical protein